MGAEQLDILTGEGVPSHAIVVGHSCGSSNLDYHLTLLDRGAYLGFDRFGLELLHPDRARTAALIGLLGVGFERQIVLSHDTVWCWRGRAPVIPASALADWQPTHLFRRSSRAARGGRAAGEDRRHAGREPAPLLRDCRDGALLRVPALRR